MRNEMTLVSLKIEETGGFFWAGDSKYFINGRIVLITSGNFIPTGKTRTERIVNKVIKSIFAVVDRNKAKQGNISVFVPKRWLTFLKKVEKHEGHGRRLVAKFLSQSSGHKRIDYPVSAPLDVPKEFAKLLDGATEQYEKVGGCFDTSWWRMLEQISSFGNLRLVKSYTTEKEYNPINHYYKAESKYNVVIDNGVRIYKFSVSEYMGQITDVKYYSPYKCFFLRDEVGVWLRV